MKPLCFFSLIVTFIISSAAFAAAPNGLMTDLLEHTDKVWHNGTRTVLKLEDRQTLPEYQTATIHSKKPSFSWLVNDERQNVLQTAYQVNVSKSPLADDASSLLWDSGKTESSQSVALRYGGKDLPPNSVIYWKVKTWNNGDEQPFSEPKAFLTAAQLVDYQTARYPLEKTSQKPVKQEQRDGFVFIDFGKDAFGQLRLKWNGQTETQPVTVHFGEAAKDGRIDRKPGGTIRYTAYPLELKAGTTDYKIQFRSDKRNTGSTAVKMPEYIGEVYPFRYVELEGVDSSAVTVERDRVHYPFDDDAASFHSDNEILNQVWELSQYSMKATSFCGVFVDGDRERIPYEADALINQLGFYSVQREYSISRFSHEYLIRHATWPTEWILQSVLMAYTDYFHTGDKRSMETFYEDLKAKLLLPLADPETGLISTKTGKQTPELMKAIHYNGKEIRDIVDWPHTGILGLGKSEGGETDAFVFRDYNVVINAYHYLALQQMAAIAYSLDKKEDGQTFRQLAEKVKNSFNTMFFDTKNHRYVDGDGTDHSAQHSNMFALAFGLVPVEERQNVLNYIKSRGMACSVYASQFLMDAVYGAGDDDYGLQLLSSDAERSWYNMIRAGSTISMEAWDNKYKPNQDWNHAWGAVPANIIPRQLLGIGALSPGFEKVRIMPQIGSLKNIEAKIPTIRGTISMQITGGNKMTLNIPANMKADVCLPNDESKQVGSGKHTFEW